MNPVACDCCKREVPKDRIDGLYGVCGECAFEHSLDHWPCDHGESERAELALRTTSAQEKP